MERIVHDLIQGTPAWDQFRLEHNGASEAAAMLGLSKNVTRSELLRAKHTGIAKEFSDFVQTRILDKGHELEALARPIVEEIIGEELYPATYSYGSLSASCDGLTIDGTKAFEHKQWNAALADAVTRGSLPDEYMPQCQQIMLVTGAEEVIFVVSDGTAEKMARITVLPSKEWRARIVAGWRQFEEDLAGYQIVESAPAAIAAPTMALPALSIQVQGAISLISNLDIFGQQLGKFIDGVDKAPSDDQGFAAAEAAIKTLQKAQDALEQAEASALAQTSNIDDMRRTVGLYRDQARTARLMLEKLVKARKESIRIEILQGGRDALIKHIAALNSRLGVNYMPSVPVDFAGVIKGKRTIASLHDSVDTELARAKIACSEIADRIAINLRTLRTMSGEMDFLFPDESQLVMKSNEDLQATIKARLSDHQAAEQKRLDAERERIRKEEADKLVREAAEQAERVRRDEQLKADADARRNREQQAEADRVARIAREAEQRKADEQFAADAAAKREQQAKADELLDLRSALVKICDRCGDAKEFHGVVKAINAYFAKSGDPRRGEQHRQAA